MYIHTYIEIGRHVDEERSRERNADINLYTYLVGLEGNRERSTAGSHHCIYMYIYMYIYTYIFIYIYISRVTWSGLKRTASGAQLDRAMSSTNSGCNGSVFLTMKCSVS